MRRGNPLPVGLEIWLAAYHDRPCRERGGVRRDRGPRMRPATASAMSAPMIRSFLTVSTGTLASRLLGFARDSLIAALLGTGAVADAFLAAFQLVNVVRRLLSEGGAERGADPGLAARP